MITRRESNLFFDVLHVLREDIASSPLSLTLIQAHNAVVTSTTESPRPVHKAYNSNSEQDHNHRVKNGESNLLLLEQSSKTQQSKWSKEECHSNVHKQETTPPQTGGLSEVASSSQ